MILPPGGFFIQTSTGLCHYGVSKTAEDLTVAKISDVIDDLVPVANVLKIIGKREWASQTALQPVLMLWILHFTDHRENIAISA